VNGQTKENDYEKGQKTNRVEQHRMAELSGRTRESADCGTRGSVYQYQKIDFFRGFLRQPFIDSII
jgi:hypothetical protein